LFSSCHPNLIKTEKLIPGVNDGDEDGESAADGQAADAGARKLTAAIVGRVKQEGLDKQECSICTDTIAFHDGVLLGGCGHPYCRLCIEAYLEAGNENGCPLCRKDVDANKFVTFASFRRVHIPEAASKVKDEESEDEDEDEEDDLVKNFKSSAKIDRCLELLDKIRQTKPGEKSIVFTQWRGMHAFLSVPLTQRGVKFVRIDGTMNIQRRAEAVETFSTNPNVNVLIISLRCGSLGLNLTCANHVILTDIWWNPALEDQAMDRAHRFGQKKPVTVHKLTVANSVEDRILELQAHKANIFKAAFDGGSLKKLGGRLNLADLKALFGSNEQEGDSEAEEDP
jgi:SNF2 family DNA or RNA helicase